MLKNLLILLAAASGFAAGDPWQKVRDLKSGAELRVYKKGVSQPILARMDELGEENLLVVVKNEQVAIPRSDIDRIDARPPQTASRVTKQTTVTKETGIPDAKPPVSPQKTPGSGSSYSTNVSIGDKPGFETVYRRQSPPTPPPGK